jgi:hypothetical protein
LKIYNFWDWGCGSVVEWLSCMCETLGLISSTSKKVRDSCVNTQEHY